jgi:hypothetical protein
MDVRFNARQSIDEWVKSLINELKGKVITGDLVNSWLDKKLEGIELSEEEVFKCLYWASILLDDLNKKIEVGEQIEDPGTVKYIYFAITVVLKEELACRREKISRKELHEKAGAEYEKWLDSDNNDEKFIQNRINKSYDDLEIEIKEYKINRLKKLNAKISNLEKDFDPEKSQKILEELKIIATGQTDTDWELLNSVSKNLVNIIQAQTTSALNEEIQDAKKQRDGEYDKEVQEARTYSGQVVVPDPDRAERRFQFTSEDGDNIRSRYKFLNKADEIVQSPNFKSVIQLQREIGKRIEQRRFPGEDDLTDGKEARKENKKEPKPSFFKKHPIFTGILIGLGVTILAAAVVIAVVFTGGIAAAPIAGAAAIAGAAITGATGTTAAITGAVVIGAGLAVTGAAVGAAGGAIYEKASGETVEMRPIKSERIVEKIYSDSDGKKSKTHSNSQSRIRKQLDGQKAEVSEEEEKKLTSSYEEDGALSETEGKKPDQRKKFS